MASLPKEIAVSSDVLFQELGNETVLLDLKNEIYYGLDDVGSRLWQLLTENGNPATRQPGNRDSAAVDRI